MTNPPPDSPRWGFLGSGQMAGALVRGMVRAGTALPGAIRVSDPIAASRDRLATEAGVVAIADNREVVSASDVVVLAVKPQVLPAVLEEIRPAIGPGHLVVSIAAGVSLATIAAALGPDARRLIRVMPNTPSLIGEGASAFALGPAATADDEATIRSCLDAVGRSYKVAEPLLDAVTGLSGGGPAYAYLMIDALSDGGVRMGLPREVATALAAQTLLGAARMVLETGLHPGTLKDQVTSPGGTTIAGLHAMERAGIRAGLIDAVEAATRRSIELGRA